MAINVRESRDIDFDQILASLAEIYRHKLLIVAAYLHLHNTYVRSVLYGKTE